MRAEKRAHGTGELRTCLRLVGVFAPNPATAPQGRLDGPQGRSEGDAGTHGPTRTRTRSTGRPVGRSRSVDRSRLWRAGALTGEKLGSSDRV